MAERPTSPPAACGCWGRARSTTTRCAPCARPGWPASSSWRSSRPRRLPPANARPGRGRSRRSASSPSCGGSSPLRARSAGSRCSTTSAPPRPCCPSSTRSAASSRPATTTATPTATRSRCSSERSRSRTTPSSLFGTRDGRRVAAVLAEPLADALTRGEALRWGALLHDAAKPQTQTPLHGGGFGFPHHDRLGAELSREVLGRLRTSERLRAHVAALARHHLRLGFLVHARPLDRRAVYAYLSACAPVEVDVTVLSVADRLATRGRQGGGGDRRSPRARARAARRGTRLAGGGRCAGAASAWRRARRRVRPAARTGDRPPAGGSARGPVRRRGPDPRGGRRAGTAAVSGAG